MQKNLKLKNLICLQKNNTLNKNILNSSYQKVIIMNFSSYSLVFFSKGCLFYSNFFRYFIAVTYAITI